MSPEVSRDLNRAIIFSQIHEKKTLYDQIYDDAKMLYKTRKDISSQTLREELFIPFDLSLQIMEKLRLENIDNNEGI